MNGRKYIVGREKLNFTCVFWLTLMSLVFLKELLTLKIIIDKDHGFWISIFSKQQIFTSFVSYCKPMNYKWIFNIKYNADGCMARHKIHLVPTRFSQGENIDFNSTYCLVAWMESIWVVLAILTIQDLEVHKIMDVKSVFLIQDLSKEIHMQQLESFVVKR